MLAVLSAYPVLLLVLRGSMGVLFFVMVALSMALLVRSGVWRDKALWNAEIIAFALAMASAVAVILPAQIYHHDLQWKPYDEAMRLLLAVPICLAVRISSTPVVQVLGLSMPAGAMLAMIVVGGDPNSGTDGRLGTYFLNVIHFGNLALMLGFLSLFSLRLGHERSLVPVTLKLCGLLVGVYLSFRSGTRGGWLVVPVLLLIWGFMGVRRQAWTNFAVVLGLTGVVAVVGYFMYDVVQQRTLDVQSDLAALASGDKDTSIGVRLQILQGVAHILRENPLFGTGHAGYKATLSALAQSGVITAEAARLGIAEVHNQILSYAVKYGLPGLISGILIHAVPLVIFLRACKRTTGEARTAAAMGVCLVTGFLVFGLTVEIFNLKHTVAFYSLTLGVLLGVATRDDWQGASMSAADRGR